MLLLIGPIALAALAQDWQNRLAAVAVLSFNADFFRPDTFSYTYIDILTFIASFHHSMYIKLLSIVYPSLKSTLSGSSLHFCNFPPPQFLAKNRDYPVFCSWSTNTTHPLFFIFL